MKRFLFFASLALLLLTACGGAKAENYADESPALAPAQPLSVYTDEAAEDNASMRNTTGIAAEAIQQKRLVIKDADLRLVVDDPEKKMDEIVALANSLGGYVVNSEIYQTYADSGAKVPEGNISVRIPAEKMDTALEEIKTNVVEVDSENISGQDVTDQYVDLQSRLKAKKATEENLLKILAEAQTTEETLAVYSELQIIQSDIEVLTGQINYYEQSAAMSSINITLIASEKIQPIEIGGWKLGETTSKAVQNLINYLQGFVRFIITFVILVIPVLITIFLPFYLAFLALRAFLRRRKKKTVKTPPQKE